MKKLLSHICTVFILGVFTSCSTDMHEPLPENANLKSSDDNAGFNIRRLDSEKLHIFKGPQVQYGDGKLRSFLSLDENNYPVEIGLIMTPEVFDNLEILPPEVVFTLLPLHHKAKEVTPFEHLGVKFSLGHPPAFFAPHFDFYFYMISNEERLAIPEYTPATEGAFTLLPPEGFMPENYGTPPGEGGAFPQIGKHWLPLNLPAYLPFSSIMVLGSFNGESIFVEPMATVEFLQSNPDISVAYSQPEFFHESSNYPTYYNIYVDPKTQDIYITLSTFVAR